jgi:DnaA-homolog protein
MTPMEQLVFDLAPPEAPSFASFLAGRNAEAVAALARFAAGEAIERSLFLWGAAGVGKSHLLRATVADATARGAAALYVAHPGVLVAMDPEMLARHALVAVDAIEAGNAEAQARLFTLFNSLRETEHRFIGAASVAPASLDVREDLRTRLGWELVYEVVPLADSDKPAALAGYASRRGFAISEDVIRYLLAHIRRDMPALLAALVALDRHSLASQRPITVPMLRDWLQRDIRLR